MRFPLPRVSSGVRIPALVACVMFLTPCTGSAGPIELSTQFWYDGGAFNQTGFHAQDSLSLGSLGGLMRAPCIGGGPDCALALRGTMEILTGPLLDHQFIPGNGGSVDDVSRYVYGAGDIRLTAEWDDPSLAAYLHVARGTTGGSFQLVADVYGSQDPLDRVAAFTGAPLTIDAAVPIPEPSFLLLLGLGVAGIVARQLRNRDSH
jgi:hypothetical protein